ncbi:Carbon-nitrogen hydrolase [Penicillium angulare]|uniref:Carbon-nitrogen hydrolase n=1 Tax=Penicillium angulare TaxID=116970 RepID=UPI0025409BD3|nr:Carbon-nitrogen hydrolase [Penicillium angulare]KAJ5280313.1 Carbon-nitrogen hydrolase [Penicillium angulare]
MGHCSLNQWALDFEGGAARIIESIQKAKAACAALRVGPELEITGDMKFLMGFLEEDTILHSWEMLVSIIDHPDCQDIVVDVGMPVRHRNARYNCRVIFYNRKIILIRPKMWLTNDGNYREHRHFIPWQHPQEVEDYYLKETVGSITGQYKVPFGDAVISTRDTCLGLETCEELFTPNVFISHMTWLSVGIYLYANQQGCDGDRFARKSLNDVEVVTATVDIEEVRTYRSSISRGMQASKQSLLVRLDLDVRVSRRGEETDPSLTVSQPIKPRFHTPEEDIALGPACWFWDYLRRCGAAGFFIPLSGGIDSCATSVIVHSMCREALRAVGEDNEQVIKDVRRLSAGLNPIGYISKVDLKKFIKWAGHSFELPVLEEFLHATPTAELEPRTATYVQSDEADMGLTYAELGTSAYLRKVAKLGPWSNEKLMHLWGNEYKPREVYEKTRHFFYNYAINRHKMTVLTPSYHAEQYHDLRQFLYPSFTWAYKMEDSVKFWESRGWTTRKTQKKSVKAD